MSALHLSHETSFFSAHEGKQKALQFLYFETARYHDNHFPSILKKTTT